MPGHDIENHNTIISKRILSVFMTEFDA